jgi:hypothetical protein
MGVRTKVVGWSRWTRQEVAVLRKMYRNRSNAEIAGVLGRKVVSVVFKARRLGLAKSRKRLSQMGRENIRNRWHPPKPRRPRKRHH